MGFGYDFGTSDYKVVIVGHTSYVSLIKVEVYTLSTDSWKEIQMDIEVCGSPDDCKIVYHNGVSYWFYWDFLDNAFTITCFDFGDEVFRSRPLPDYVQRDVRKLQKYLEFGVWNESLVLLCFHRSDPAFIDMWVMNSNSSVNSCSMEESYSWTKHLTIGPLADVTRPLVFWGDDLLYLTTKFDELLSYNLSTQELTLHPFYFQQYGIFVVYVKSLVSVLKKAGRNSTTKTIDPTSGSTRPYSIRRSKDEQFDAHLQDP